MAEGADAEEEVDPDLAARVEALTRLHQAHEERTSRIHEKRGRFLSDHSALVGQVGTFIAGYFDPNWRGETHKLQFYTWVIGTMSDSQVVQIGRRVATAINSAGAAAWMAELDELSRMRNVIAHGRVGINLYDLAEDWRAEDLFAGDPAHLLHSRAGLRIENYGEVELDAGLARLESLADRWLGVLDELAGHRGTDVSHLLLEITIEARDVDR